MRPDYIQRNREIRELRKCGATYAELAERYGISAHRIEVIVKTPEKDYLGFSPEVYGPLRRAMRKDFTLDDLYKAIEKGLPVHHIGEKRCEEISRLLGRDVIFSREYTHILSNGMMFKSSMYDVVLRFKERGK